MSWTPALMFPCILPPSICYLPFIHLVLLPVHLNLLIQNWQYGCHRSPCGPYRTVGFPSLWQRAEITYQQKLVWLMGLEISGCHQVLLLLLSLRQHILVGSTAKPRVTGMGKRKKGSWNPMILCKDKAFKRPDFLRTSGMFHHLPLMPHWRTSL